MALVEVAGLVKRFGRTTAVDGVSFSVEGGEVYCLVGPNGAGKTTTLKAVVGLLRPDAGRVSVCGFDVREEREGALRCLAYVPDVPALPPHLTVEEVLRLVRALRGLPWDEGEARRVLELLGLDGERGKPVGRLSRGNLQKAAVAAALVVEPRVLVMDEPLTNMDMESQALLKRELRRLAAAGTAILLSSHMAHLVEDVGTRLAVMDRGRFLFEGTLADLLKATGARGLEEAYLRALGKGGG